MDSTLIVIVPFEVGKADLEEAYRQCFGPESLTRYRLDNLLSGLSPSNILRGFTLPFAEQVLLCLAVGLLCFGLLALIPIPPLDGFGILWSALKQPGAGAQKMRLWLEEKNLGVLILLVCCFFPLSYPLLLVILDVLGVLFLRLWGGPVPL